MEDVLEVYRRPYDARVPVVTIDEKSKQLLGHTREPLAGRPGSAAKQDYEYERKGTCNAFMVFEPLVGWREVKITARRAKTDWAELMREVSDVHYPNAERIVVVMDNLNTHSLASLYEAFEPEEAWRLAQRFEVHYTPKHGSWLNMAEIELSVLSRQCLNRRIADQATVEREVAAWVSARNARKLAVDWRFTTSDARVKLKKLYPSIQE
jgi:transposase